MFLGLILIASRWKKGYRSIPLRHHLFAVNEGALAMLSHLSGDFSQSNALRSG